MLGWTGIMLNSTTGLVACLVLGIATDDTVHFMAKFNRIAKQRADETAGVREALWNVGRPITYTTLALCLGFLAISTSQLQNQAEFGALAAFTLGLAWLVDITLSPALATRMHVVTVWDVLSFDLGEDPRRSIPLLAGLSRHQARVAVLVTSVGRHAAGFKLMRSGDPGEAMYVLIEGEMVAKVPTRDGALEVKLYRGALIGEIGPFCGQRTADIDALTDVTLMRLTVSNLERLRRRHPRIGAQIYRNLTLTLAGRMGAAGNDSEYKRRLPLLLNER
jgi:hypothetical protein